MDNTIGVSADAPSQAVFEPANRLRLREMLYLRLILLIMAVRLFLFMQYQAVEFVFWVQAIICIFAMILHLRPVWLRLYRWPFFRFVNPALIGMNLACFFIIWPIGREAVVYSQFEPDNARAVSGPALFNPLSEGVRQYVTAATITVDGYEITYRYTATIMDFHQEFGSSEDYYHRVTTDIVLKISEFKYVNPRARRQEIADYLEQNPFLHTRLIVKPPPPSGGDMHFALSLRLPTGCFFVYSQKISSTA